MSGLKRHVGQIKNTGQRCVVVFMQLPERPDHALVIPTDSLPDRVEHAVMQILESPEGQANPCLAHVMNARLMPEMGRSVLRYLHETGRLQAVPIDNMVMLPMPNMPFPLRKIIEDMGGVVTPAPAPVAAPVETQLSPQALAEAYQGHRAPEVAPPALEPPSYAQQTQQAHDLLTQGVNKFNPYGQTEQIETHSRNNGVAVTLLAEARDLEAIARQKREQAYNYDPSLRPQEVLPRAVVEGDTGQPVTISITTDEAPVKRSRKAPKTES